MKRAHTHVTTPKSPQEAYDYLVDFTRHPEWRFDVVESELVAGEPGQAGARYRQRVKPGRKEMTTEVQVTKAERPHAVAFRTVDSGPVSAAGEWAIRAREADSGSGGAGTEVVYDGTMEMHGFLRLFEPFMGPAFKKTAERYERALEERLSE
jgi:hypothetical protein